jgi:two-component system CheB/CheR fusion protein
VNAAKYTPDGGHIRLQVTVGGGFAEISVADNGRGISRENLTRIFQLFMQAETGLSSPGESGLGIGLTLARSLMEMHGGSIEARSPGLGQGSTFVARLALAQDVPPPGAPEEEAAESEDTGGLRVLVIDDNRDSADSATDVLRLLGNRVDTAYDGPSSLPVAQRLRPQMVLMDLAMPGMDGYETRQRLLAEAGLQPRDTFFVAMTGFGNEDDKRRTRSAGFDAHLTKPVELDALMLLLNEAKVRFASRSTV